MAFTVADAMPRKNYDECSLAAAPAVVSLAKALNVTTDELLGLKPPKAAPVEDGSESRRQWNRFQMIATLPERDQKDVVRLINSMVGSSLRKNGRVQAGEHRRGR